MPLSAFGTEILHWVNWVGNLLCPFLGALFILIGIVQFGRGYHQVWYTWTSSGCGLMMVSAITRLFESAVTSGSGNDMFSLGLLNLTDYVGCTLLPVYAGMQMALFVVKMAGIPHGLARGHISEFRHLIFCCC